MQERRGQIVFRLSLFAEPNTRLAKVSRPTSTVKIPTDFSLGPRACSSPMGNLKRLVREALKEKYART
jgi:hypothetical protein